jgi:hypothetical protein
MFSATRHIVEPKLQGNATTDQLQRGPIHITWEAYLFATKKRKEEIARATDRVDIGATR